MSKYRTIFCRWDKEREVLVPHPRYLQAAKRQFEDGGDYPIGVVEERNMRLHSRYFATLHELWMNLPENVAPRFPTAEHLRAWALVQTGQCTENDVVLDSPKDARTLVAQIRRRSPYAVIVLKGNVVKVLDPISQAVDAMKADHFKESQKAVLDLIESMVPHDRKGLRQQVARTTPPDRRH